MSLCGNITFDLSTLTTANALFLVMVRKSRLLDYVSASKVQRVLIRRKIVPKCILKPAEQGGNHNSGRETPLDDL